MTDHFEPCERCAAYVRSLTEPLEQEIRNLLWLGHGHIGLYGDDGEMQCGECGTLFQMHDYKRAPLDEVRRVAGLARLHALERVAEAARSQRAAARKEALEAVSDELDRQMQRFDELIANATSHKNWRDAEQYDTSRLAVLAVWDEVAAMRRALAAPAAEKSP